MNFNPNQIFIIDTDPGGDDAHAILLALIYLKNKRLSALTISYGNISAKKAYKNACYIVAQHIKDINTDSLDCLPSIYLGATGPLHQKRIKCEFWGKDGLLDITEPNKKESDSDNIRSLQNLEIHATRKILELVLENPGKVDILCLGPLTNLALCCESFADFSRIVGQVLVMGGTLFGQGNITPLAEFNFYSDPDSVNIVIDRLGGKLLLLPWEVTQTCKPSEDQHRALVECKDPQCPSSHRARLMGYIDKALAAKSGEGVWCDQLLVALYLRPELILSKAFYRARIFTAADIESEKCKSSDLGRLVVHLDEESLEETVKAWPRIEIVTQLDQEGVAQFIINSFHPYCNK